MGFKGNFLIKIKKTARYWLPNKKENKANKRKKYIIRKNKEHEKRKETKKANMSKKGIRKETERRKRK